MWPSFGAFGWPCASTSVKFVTSIAKYRSWEMVGPGFGDTIVIVGVPAAGPCVATTLTDAEKPGVNAVHVQVHVAFGRSTDLTDATGLHEDEVGHREADDHRRAIADDLVVRRRED